MYSKLKYSITTLLLLLLVSPVFSQSSMYLLKGKKKQKIHFEFLNNVLVIPVFLNGKKLSFILDTGARNTILFGATNADSLVLNNQIKTKIMGIGGGEPVHAIVSRDNRIQIKNIYGYGQKVFVILDDSFDLSLKMGKPIHGIIGYELFKNFVTTINFQSKIIRFYDPAHYNPPRSKKYKRFPLNFYKNKPYLNTQSQLIDGSKHQTKLLIDTGCSDALWLFEDASSGLQVTHHFFTDYLGEGLSGSIKGKRSKIKSFQIGDFTFKDITAAFLDSTSTSRAKRYTERDGSIGSNLLQRFKVILDYPNQKIYLKKAKSFKDDFRYNRSGLGISYHKDAKILTLKENQRIVISENSLENKKTLFEIDYRFELKRLFYIYYIRENSPAEKTGLQVNDLIIRINNKASYEYNLNEIIGLLYADEGKVIRMDIERNGLPIHYKFKLKKPL